MRMEDMVLFSVDDHLIEPPGMFEGRIPKKFEHLEPKFHHGENGDNDYWMVGGRRTVYMGSNAVVGRPREEYGFEPSALSQLRPGCYDIHARIGDMNVNGVAASINFGTLAGMAGEPFLSIPDKDFALTVVQAWNDWHIEEWAGTYPDRIVPLSNLPFWDPELSAREVRRVKAKGCNVISFPPNPVLHGQPSFHTEHWDPVWKACVEENVAICIHFADSSYAVPSPDSPVDAMISCMPIGLYRVAADLTWSPVLRKFPDIQFALSEGGAGWIPYLKERMDTTFRLHSQWTRQNFGDKKPSEIFDRNVATCFIDDPIGIKIRHAVGIQNITWECDYPHADCTWPESADRLWRDLQAAEVPDDEIDLITHRNAMRIFNFDLFKLRKREELTVGALRDQARAAGVDTTPMKSGSGRPPSDSEQGPVSMRDVAKQLGARNEAA
ncbi:hypothetical protein ASE00_13625 [Sphingomonas sp. Root710]|uniref:amidohydrolase family protein n=1 Tax=Sphingomonas sp. Root710 TaxID=1736594 RepID=UPI0006FE7F07|nr:amidohydrolase family protein [Sphingomonas sp. Root710]KRB83022.1 hypothetical protein ASE00_13625 [Sphingomonas sp. Root710]